MAAKIFLTGASGYIGGEVLYQLSRLPTEHHIRCLVRSDHKAKLIRDAIPSVEIAKGDLDDFNLIEREASAADIVFHLASTRHETSSRAIIKGLSRSDRRTPGYWFQIGGASMFSSKQIQAQAFGEAWNKTHDDVADIEEIKAVIRANPARVIDNLILEQDSTRVRTALVAGPIIYGEGRGPVNTGTIQGPAIARYTLKNGQSFQIGKGENVWSTVHVTDISKVFVLLLEAALQGRADLWNENGIYLPESGKTSFGNFAKLISAAAKKQGLIESEHIKKLTGEEADQVTPHGSVILGTTAQTSSTRANRYLGWQPAGISVSEDIPLMVHVEAQRLQEPLAKI